MKLTDFLDADEAAEAPRPLTVTSNSDAMRWENISHNGEGPFDKLDKIADWDDIFVYGANYTKLDRPPDSKTLVAYKRPGAESDYSIKILKDNPHVAVAHSDMCGLPTGGKQKLTKARVCAIWYHNGDERAAATAMLQGAAGYLPPQIQDAVRGPDKSTYSGQDREPLDNGLPADDPYQDQPEPDYEAIFAEDVEKEARRFRVRDAARRKIRREQQRDLGNLDPITLADFLAIPDEPVDYRIAGVWPSGGRIVLAAQWKVGKTTLTGNVIRALADGALFLNRFQTQPAEVTLLDFEMDPRKIRQWLRDQQIKYASHVHVIPLRGKVSSFDILDPQIRSEWAARIRGSDVVIFDCLRPILDALGLDENRDAGRLLMAIDELLNEAGVPEALIVHHMGHSGGRSRGDSRIIDWPDATWKLVRENPDLENSPRYFSAYGRDVYQAESLLEYNSETRRLALVGGNRKDASNTRLLEPLLEILRSSEDGMSGRQLDDAMMDAGHGRNAARDARKYAVKNGHVITEPGKARAVIHKLPADSAPVRHSAPEGVAHHASESGEECASAPIDGARTLTTLAPASNPESAPATDNPGSAPALIETIQSLLPGAAIIDEESEKPSLWEPPKVTSDPNLDRHAPCPICGESFYGPAGSEQCIEDHPEDAE